MLSIAAVLIICLWAEIVDIVVVAAVDALAIAERIDKIAALTDVVRHDNDVAAGVAGAVVVAFLVLGDTKAAHLDYSVYCDLQGMLVVNY